MNLIHGLIQPDINGVILPDVYEVHYIIDTESRAWMGTAISLESKIQSMRSDYVEP